MGNDTRIVWMLFGVLVAIIGMLLYVRLRGPLTPPVASVPTLNSADGDDQSRSRTGPLTHHPTILQPKSTDSAPLASPSTVGDESHGMGRHAAPAEPDTELVPLPNLAGPLDGNGFSSRSDRRAPDPRQSVDAAGQPGGDAPPTGTDAVEEIVVQGEAASDGPPEAASANEDAEPEAGDSQAIDARSDATASVPTEQDAEASAQERGPVRVHVSDEEPDAQLADVAPQDATSHAEATEGAGTDAAQAETEADVEEAVQESTQEDVEEESTDDVAEGETTEQPPSEADAAPTGQQSPDEPSVPTRTYVVRDGETLLDIARDQLGHPTYWTVIYRLNRHQLGAQISSQLTPGTKLYLPLDRGPQPAPAPPR